MLRREEMRRSPRVPVDRLIVGVRGGNRVVHGNLSTGGVGFEVPERLGVGEPIAVCFSLPETGEPVSIAAEVRHVRRETEGYYVGARFIDMDVLVQNPLDRYIEEVAIGALVQQRATRTMAAL